MTNLIAFHGKQETKDFIIARLKAHRAADEIIQGTGWENGKGCAIGCTLNDYSHKTYESELGIPEEIAQLEDSIFEGLPNELAKDFPLQLIESINVGADLSMVHRKWFVWMLTDANEGVIKYADTDACRAAIQTVSDLHLQTINGAAAGDAARAAAWDAAWAAAWAAAWDAAWDAAGDAARDAGMAAARAAAWDAGMAAARDAGRAAGRAAGRDAAWAAARDAAWAAARAAAWDTAWNAAWAAARIKQAAKLIEILKETK